jgi:uncharacterized protein YbjT (DUF2867 family)
MFTIVGATGKVGRATIRALRAQGHAVRAVVRDAGKAEALRDAGCELAIADLSDEGALTRAFRGATAVQLICPVLARAEDALAEMTAMVDTAANALAAAGHPAVVAISDYGAEVPFGTGVALIFHAMEQRLRRLGGPLTLLRSAEHMQNWTRQLKHVADSGALPSMHHPLTKRFPTVAAEDVGAVSAEYLLTAAAQTAPRIAHVEGPRRYTPEEVASTFAAVLERDVRARELPRAQWPTALKMGGLGDSYARLVVELYDAHNAGRIDAETSAGEIRHGTTELRAVLASLPRPAPRSPAHG